jgi:hypothetical protein
MTETLSSPWGGLCAAGVQLLPDPVLQVEGVHIVEIFAVPQVVMESAEYQDLFLDNDHAVTAARRGSARRRHLTEQWATVNYTNTQVKYGVRLQSL